MISSPRLRAPAPSAALFLLYVPKSAAASDGLHIQSCVFKQKKGSEEGSSVFELSCIFANGANLLLSQINMGEGLCLLTMGH